MPFPAILGTKRQRLTKHRLRLVKFFQFDQAHAEGIEPIDLRTNQLSGFFEMGGCAGAVSFAVLQDGKHCMSSWLARAQAQEMVQEGHGLRAVVCCISALRCAGKRAYIIWGDL